MISRFEKRGLKLVAMKMVQLDEEILKVHSKGKPLAEDVSLATLAKRTPYMTGADLENLLNEAALLAAREDKKAITKDNIEEATIKVVAGPEKKSRFLWKQRNRFPSFLLIKQAFRSPVAL